MDSSIATPDAQLPARPAVPLARCLALFILAITLQILLSLPTALDFKLFAFYDPGATLKVDWLLSPAGGSLVPTTDFAYSYGLLSLLIGKIWFALFGRDPFAFWLYGSLGMILMTLGLVRIGRALSFSWMQYIILLASLPLAIPAYYLSLTHVTEAALLIHALADQAQKKHPRALLLVTIAATLKPSMSYLYGLMLIVWILKPILLKPRGFNPGEAAQPNHSLKLAIVPLLPATAAALILFATLAATFGPLPLIRTLLPITGGASYAAAGFGFFFGSGRDFWILSSPLNYILSPTGWWILSTIIMITAALTAIARKRRNLAVPGGELILTLALMHAAFIFIFYAWRDSWTYYAYLPALGLAAAWNIFPLRRSVFALILILIACACWPRLTMTAGEWAGKSRRPDTNNLWIYNDQLTLWRHTRELARNPHTTWLVNGYVAQMFPDIHTPPSWWLSPKLQNEKEIAAIRRDLAASDTIIRWTEHARLDPWLYPEFSDLTPQFQTTHADTWFIIEKRTTPPLKPRGFNPGEATSTNNITTKTNHRAHRTHREKPNRFSLCPL